MAANQKRYLGSKLKAILSAQGRRQDWLAEQMDVSPSFLARQINGEKRINGRHALKAANALGIPVHWLEEEPVAAGDERPGA